MADQRIYALFQDVLDAERAIGALEDHGIKRDQIGVLARRPAEQNESGRVRADYGRLSDAESVTEGEPIATYQAQPGALPPAGIVGTVQPTSDVDTSLNVETVGKHGLTTTTPQDAAAGAAVGSGVGLVAGILGAAAMLMIPGVGPILAGGALATAIGAAVGTTVAGAVAGGAVGYLKDMGMPEQAAVNFADRINEGDYLITVTADTSQYDDISQLLMKYNAVGVDTSINPTGVQAAQEWRTDPAATTFAPPTPGVSTHAVPAVVYDAQTAPSEDSPVTLPDTDIPITTTNTSELVTLPDTDIPVRTGTTPHQHLVTEALDGTPLVPAQVVDDEEQVVTPVR